MGEETRQKLEAGDYISFATRKRNGDFVPTPVWFAPYAGSYYLFSAGEAGKVKRLRNFSEARIAPCTVTGKLTGDWIDATAHLLDSEEDRATALGALRRKYFLQMRIGDLFARLTGRYQRRAYIRVDLPG
ncbi:PPOX class F420-dependent oxidoreductase [Parahaliea mediterranea]|uniref:PPOX class F420-dependent oxidoreductase n=1 Tax=Parahaliea mediterranea TaxID=651086 RepID=A0A939IKL4_9GAMM|nr:PPOX class F420-dependent oxidoreductase [Parahaliea mediterranea]MBN7795570.1 PPOX class F420-dependent oxidoreductase [Parahaliea mediterranea]